MFHHLGKYMPMWIKKSNFMRILKISGMMRTCVPVSQGGVVKQLSKISKIL
jgi:hypothetical protein